jgi:nucleoside phosphorylase
MEGAAIAHVCSLSGVPVAEIRGISNIIEDRTAAPLNKSDIVKAAENVQKFFLERLV